MKAVKRKSEPVTYVQLGGAVANAKADHGLCLEPSIHLLAKLLVACGMFRSAIRCSRPRTA